jgi:predicted nucleic-acid-binding Zn-ribbon protein
MPIRNTTVYCVNHVMTVMVKNSGYNALIKLERTGSKVIFDANSGIPVVAYSCPICGYMEIYDAQKTSAWQEIESETEQEPLIGALEFERTAIDALIQSDNISQNTAVDRSAVVMGDGLVREIDAILYGSERIYLIEVKNSYSKRGLQIAIEKLTQAAYILRDRWGDQEKEKPIIPMVIIPSVVRAPDILSGVPILKFDPNNFRFINEEEIFDVINRNNPTIIKI